MTEELMLARMTGPAYVLVENNIVEFPHGYHGELDDLGAVFVDKPTKHHYDDRLTPKENARLFKRDEYIW